MKVHELMKDHREDKESLGRLAFIITLIFLSGFWLKSLWLGQDVPVPGSLTTAFMTLLGYQGYKKLVDKKKLVSTESTGGQDGS